MQSLISLVQSSYQALTRYVVCQLIGSIYTVYNTSMIFHEKIFLDSVIFTFHTLRSLILIEKLKGKSKHLFFIIRSLTRRIVLC